MDAAGKLGMPIFWFLAPEERNVYRIRQAIIPNSGGATYAICRSSGVGKPLRNEFYKHYAPTALRSLPAVSLCVAIQKAQRLVLESEPQSELHLPRRRA